MKMFYFFDVRIAAILVLFNVRVESLIWHNVNEQCENLTSFLNYLLELPQLNAFQLLTEPMVCPDCPQELKNLQYDLNAVFLTSNLQIKSILQNLQQLQLLSRYDVLISFLLNIKELTEAEKKLKYQIDQGVLFLIKKKYLSFDNFSKEFCNEKFAARKLKTPNSFMRNTNVNNVPLNKPEFLTSKENLILNFEKKKQKSTRAKKINVAKKKFEKRIAPVAEGKNNSINNETESPEKQLLLHLAKLLPTPKDEKQTLLFLNAKIILRHENAPNFIKFDDINNATNNLEKIQKSLEFLCISNLFKIKLPQWLQNELPETCRFYETYLPSLIEFHQNNLNSLQLRHHTTYFNLSVDFRGDDYPESHLWSDWDMCKGPSDGETLYPYETSLACDVYDFLLKIPKENRTTVVLHKVIDYYSLDEKEKIAFKKFFSYIPDIRPKTFIWYNMPNETLYLIDLFYFLESDMKAPPDIIEAIAILEPLIKVIFDSTIGGVSM